MSRKRVSIKPAPMSVELVKRLYDTMTEEGKAMFVDGFHPDDQEMVRKAINRPVGWLIPHTEWTDTECVGKYVKYVAYNPDTADRASRRDTYKPVWKDVGFTDDAIMKVSEAVMQISERSCSNA